MSAAVLQWFRLAGLRPSAAARDTSWGVLTRAAQWYVIVVIAAGAASLGALFPRAYPDPWLFAVVLAATCVTAAWKVNLLLPLGSGSTLSVSCAAKATALLLLGPQHAVVVACAGALTQCAYRVKQPYPLYRTVFSVAAEAITMGVTGLVYISLGGGTGPFDVSELAKPLVGAIGAYFAVNTGLVAAAIALSTHRSLIEVWRHDFLWSGVTYMVAGSIGAMAAVVIDRGEHWVAVLLLAPIYLTYRTYHLFLGRFMDQQRHLTDMSRMHEETVGALSQAHQAEQALAAEKERLAWALADMTRLEEVRVQLLEREQAARASAEEANRLKDEFIAIVSHELRTPLNAILGWAEMLRSGRLENPSRERAYETIFNSARRQAQLIDDLLDTAHIMSRKLRLERTFVDVEEVVRAAMQLVQPTAEARRVDVLLEAEASHGLIYGDRARLQQIAWNLLSNAIKFSDDGAVIVVRVRRQQDLVEFSVTDAGQGIAPEFLPFVFEPFRQADLTTTRHHAGLGLGLSIVKHLAEAHGGTVAAHSDGPGRGATFTVLLPLVVLSASLPHMTADRGALTGEAANTTPTLQGVSVLVVDDDEESRRVVAAHLVSRAATVLSAASASEALELLETRRVDVLLADIGMPGEDGYTLLQKVRAQRTPRLAALPAAALTAFTRRQDAEHALRAGFQLHLTKPIDAGTLVSAVARLAGRATGAQALSAV